MPGYPYVPGYGAYGHPFQPQLSPSGNHTNGQSGAVGINAGNHAPAQQQYGGFGLPGMMPGYQFGQGYGPFVPFHPQLPPNASLWPGGNYPQQPGNDQPPADRPARQEEDVEDREERQRDDTELRQDLKRVREGMDELLDHNGSLRKRRRAASPPSQMRQQSPAAQRTDRRASQSEASAGSHSRATRDLHAQDPSHTNAGPGARDLTTPGGQSSRGISSRDSNRRANNAGGNGPSRQRRRDLGR